MSDAEAMPNWKAARELADENLLTFCAALVVKYKRLSVDAKVGFWTGAIVCLAILWGV